MSDVCTIGVDHGYAAMKTAHCSFPTGVVEYEHEPYTQKDVLEYGGRYYVMAAPSKGKDGHRGLLSPDPDGHREGD